MRKLKSTFILLVIGIFLSFMSCNNLYYSTKTLKGDGNVITFEQTVSPYSIIHSIGSADVYFHASKEYYVHITTDSNLLEYVEVSSKNNTLYVKTKNGSYSFTKLVVDVYSQNPKYECCD